MRPEEIKLGESVFRRIGAKHVLVYITETTIKEANLPVETEKDMPLKKILFVVPLNKMPEDSSIIEQQGKILNDYIEKLDEEAQDFVVAIRAGVVERGETPTLFVELFDAINAEEENMLFIGDIFAEIVEWINNTALIIEGGLQ